MKTLSKKLVELIEHNSDTLIRSMVADIRKHPGTKAYRSLTEAQLYSRIFEVYRHYDKWMSDEYSREDIKKVYTALGRERRKDGFALSEVIQALIIARRHIWLLVEDKGFLDSAHELRMALELINDTLVFFDRAIFFTAVGFETAE